MPDVVKHAITHRPRSLGGTDPLPGAPFAHVFNSGTIVAGTNVPGDNYTLPFHEDETPTTNLSGMELGAEGGIVLPGRGLYRCYLAVAFSDTEWHTKNFRVGFTFTTQSQTFGDVIGSQELGGDTLEHSLSHDGTGFTNTTDRRKPEMQNDRMFLLGSGVSAANLPFSIYPWIYSYTASESTDWASVVAVIVQLSSEPGVAFP